MEISRGSFISLLEAQNITINERQFNQFELYYGELIAWNQRMNLTGLTQWTDVFLKHFYDSLSPSFYMPLQGVVKLADIGSGAGFPGIPLKILFPHLQLTIIDSLSKRISFLKHLTQALELDEVECVHSRAEDAARSVMYRDQFDLVAARAVARLSILNELCLPFVAPGGCFVAMKGQRAEEELQIAEYSMEQLNGKLRAVFSFVLPFENSERQLIVIDKIAPTPVKYPRMRGIPVRAPLSR